MFIQQCFSGCIAYKKFLLTLVKTILKVNAASTNSTDTIPFMIISYLGLFRLEELGKENFKKIINTYEVVRVNTLFQWIFNPQILTDYAREGWMADYDFEWIDNNIITGVRKNLPMLQDLIDEVEIKATGKKKQLAEEEEKERQNPTRPIGFTITKERKVTVPKPFTLHKPKIRELPEPLVIEKRVKVNVVPEFIKKRTLEKIHKENVKRKESVK